MITHWQTRRFSKLLSNTGEGIRQSFRTRQNRDLELIPAEHTCERPGRYTVAVKVIDIFGNDIMTLVPVSLAEDCDTK